MYCPVLLAHLVSRPPSQSPTLATAGQARHVDSLRAHAYIRRRTFCVAPRPCGVNLVDVVLRAVGVKGVIYGDLLKLSTSMLMLVFRTMLGMCPLAPTAEGEASISLISFLLQASPGAKQLDLR